MKVSLSALWKSFFYIFFFYGELGLDYFDGELDYLWVYILLYLWDYFYLLVYL